MIAKDIMTTDVVTIKKDTTVKEIAEILTKSNIDGVPVIDENDDLVGVVTKKDLVYKDLEPKFPSYVEFLGGLFFVESIKEYEEKLKKFFANKAEDMMTEDVVTITPDTDVKEIAELMVTKNVNRLPVIEEGKIIGIISRSDLVRILL